MKRGKSNKAKLGANLLRKVLVAEITVANNMPQPVRGSGKTAPEFTNLLVLNAIRTYIHKTKVKNLDPKIIKGFSNLITLIMRNPAYGKNVYHEEKEKINDQTNSTENA